MKEIRLSNGSIAIVDDDIFETLNAFRWSINLGGYAKISRHMGKAVSMHRLIMNAPSGVSVDHINGDKLDNRRENLRFCSQGQNVQNQRIRDSNTSGYKGVSFDKVNLKWKAQIGFNGKNMNLGRFESPEMAHEVYCSKAKELFGEFARFE